MPLTYRLCLSPVSNLYIGSIRSGGLQYPLAAPQEDLMADDKKKIMTTDAGRPVGDNQNSLTVGPRGPVVFEDFLLFEKMAHFNRERIPERVSTPRAPAPTAISPVPTPICPSTPPQNFSTPSARKLPPSSASPPSAAKKVPLTPSATPAASPSSSTLKKATGT